MFLFELFKVLALCRYDDILVNGLPDWRQPVFYYRRVRKMSNTELTLLLFLILTVGHYAVIWSIYLEKQLVRQPVRPQQIELSNQKTVGTPGVHISFMSTG